MKIIGFQELADPNSALQAYDLVFNKREGEDITFRSHITKRGVIYPGITGGNVLSREEAEALVVAMKKIKEDRFYLSLTQRFLPPEINDWLVPIDSIDSYVKNYELPYSVLENALYSIGGVWGIWFDRESIIIIGGPPVFVDTLFSHLDTNTDASVKNIIDDFGEGAKDYLMSIFEKKMVDDWYRDYFAKP